MLTLSLPLMELTTIIAVSAACITTLGAIATVFFNYRNNASGVKNDIINTYETRLVQMDSDIKTLTRKVDELTIKLDQSEIDRKKAEAILQGRNPELDKYMTLTLQLLTDIHGAVMPQTVEHKEEE